MNGKWFYLAAAALLGVLSSFSNFLLFLFFIMIYLALLYKFKHFTQLELLITLCVFALCLLSGQKAMITNHSKIPGNKSTFYLEFSENPKVDGDVLQIMAIEQTFKEKLLIRYKIQSEKEKGELQNKDFYGLICKESGALTAPAKAKNPNGFNYQQYLTEKQIFWLADLQTNPLQNCTPIKPSVLTKLKQIRFLGIQYLNQHFSTEIASLSAALIFGERNLLQPELLDDYQKTGIVHLLAISGLHVSLLVAMVFYLGIRCGVTKEIMVNVMLLLLPIYGIITGGSPSVVRSVIMIILVLVSGKWKRHVKLTTLDSISVAMILYLLFSPFVIYDVGFQLSFSVTIAIILSSSFVLKKYHHPLSRMLSTSVISQLAALPFLLFHYFELSLISIMANLFYIPLFSFIYMPGLYLLFFIQFMFGASPEIVLRFFIWIITLSNQFISQLANVPFSHFTPGRPSGMMLTIYSLTIIGIFLVWELEPYLHQRRQLFLLSCFLFSFQPIWNFLNPFGEVTMIDVGQGDSFLIHLPFNQGNYLIDTGGTVSFNEETWRQRQKPFEVGRDIVVPYLKGQGITHIDKLILSHGDMDHIGGALSIMKELKVKQILIPSVKSESEEEQQIVKEAAKRKIEVKKVSEGDRWGSGKANFYVLSPERNFSGERNRGSIAIFAKIGGLTWFFGGDLDQGGEENIIKKYPQLSVDVLKAGHHGSKTSSADSFIHQLEPKIALISVGEKNRFGHPHQEVLDRLKEVNAYIFRTDLQGAVTYQFLNENGTFSPYIP